jgi:hypothetical protein
MGEQDDATIGTFGGSIRTVPVPTPLSGTLRKSGTFIPAHSGTLRKSGTFAPTPLSGTLRKSGTFSR